jgi:peptide/nickel transport system permease protein
MTKYIIKRLLLMIPVIIGISLVVFTLLYFSPGNPVDMLLGVRASDEAKAQLREQLGLNLPFWARYFNYMKDAVTGDFGISFRTKLPVVQEIWSRLGTTLNLAFGAVAITVLIGIPVGVISAVKQYSLLDNTTLVGALFLSSMPGFWLGTLLILVFAMQARWVSSTFVNSLSGYILPWITLAAGQMATIVQNTRSNMLEVIRADYIKMARAKGAKETRVVLGHALRNALLPIITLLGMNFVELLGGAVVIEQVFTVTGLGNLALISIHQLDTPMVMGEVMFLAFLAGMANLVIDVIYVYIDPRLKSLYIKHKKRKVKASA